MATLHEGVFLNKTHAEAYMSVFSPTVYQYDDQIPRSPSKYTHLYTCQESEQSLSLPNKVFAPFLLLLLFFLSVTKFSAAVLRNHRFNDLRIWCDDRSMFLTPWIK